MHLARRGIQKYTIACAFFVGCQAPELHKYVIAVPGTSKPFSSLVSKIPRITLAGVINGINLSSWWFNFSNTISLLPSESITLIVY